MTRAALAIAKLGSRMAASEKRARMMQLCGARAATRARRDPPRDDVSLQATRMYAKGVWFEFPFEVPEVPAQEITPGPAGQAGRSSDRQLTAALDATRRQRHVTVRA
jgi:hypothetical protein